MNKIKYLCCLLGFVAGTIACDDDENNIVPKPTGITYGTVEDKAGNTYKTLTIGKQTWLAENFRYKLAESNANNQVTFGESMESMIWKFWKDRICKNMHHLPETIQDRNFCFT